VSGRVKNFHRNQQPRYASVRREINDWDESERLASRPSQVLVNHEAGCGKFFWNGKRLDLVIKDSFLLFRSPANEGRA
jgi:hypothetical protein